MIRNVIFLIATAVFLIATAPNAAAAPIFPPLVSGEYSFRVQTVAVELDDDGIPLETPTASVGIRRVDGGAGPLLTCVDAGPDELVDVTVKVPVWGSRAELRGFAYAGVGCTGDAAESVNGAYVFFVPPGGPTLELLLSPPPVP